MKNSGLIVLILINKNPGTLVVRFALCATHAEQTQAPGEIVC
jgi:hypothetical protein